jgi:hypothetical protein
MGRQNTQSLVDDNNNDNSNDNDGRMEGGAGSKIAWMWPGTFLLATAL